VVQPRQARAAAPARPRRWQAAGHLAAGVVAAMAGTLGHYLRSSSRDAGPTTVNF